MAPKWLAKLVFEVCALFEKTFYQLLCFLSCSYIGLTSDKP